ncbi:MAG TPA: DUF3108 domain-containing protein [Pyrinomonadaceae bacterium]
MNRRTMLLPAVALALVCLLHAAPSACAQTVAGLDPGPFSPTPYRVGERLSYNVSFSNFPTAAHVELFIAGRVQQSGRDGLELRGHVETIGIVSAALYAVNNDYVSFIDTATGIPYRTGQVIREGSQSANMLGALNPASGPPVLSDARASAPTPGTFDLLSAVYRLRALPLAQGAIYRLTVQSASITHEVELKVTGRELLKTTVGSSNAIVAQVRVPGNRALNDYRIRIYFSDDELHLPLLVTARHPAGEIRAELTSVEMVTPQATTAQPAPETGAQVKPPAGVVVLPPQTGGGVVAPPTPRPTPTPVPSTAEAPAASSNLGPPSAPPFAVGEQLNFNFYAGPNSQPIGTASFHVRSRGKYFGREGLLINGLMQTTGAGQTLFPVNDIITSYVDALTLLPFRTELRIQEGPRRVNWVVSADQERGNALFDDGTRVEIQAGTHDLVSVIYAMRSFDLTPGRQTRVALLVNKRARALSVASLRQGTIELGGQSIPAVELLLTTGEPRGDRFALRLWVSTDRRRLPLRLTAQTPLGVVRGDLAIIPVSVQ